MTTVIKIPAGKHSETGASGAHRWMNCPGSIGLTKKLGKDARSAGMDAAMGTAAHMVGSLCLENGEEPWEYTGTKIEVEGRYVFEVDSEMVTAVQLYVDFVNDMLEKFKDKKPILHIERSMQHPDHKNVFGQADVSIEVPDERIIIADYKNGMVPVEPTGEQCKYYGHLAYLLREASDTVKVISAYIVQPRAPHHHGPIRQAHYSPQELEAWFDDEVLPAVAATKKKNAHVVLGDWCRWCPARDHCPAIVNELMYFNLDVEPVYLTDEELSLQMRRFKAIEDYGSKFLETETYKRTVAGTKIVGYKLVEKQSTRVLKKTGKVNGKTVKVEAAAVEAFGADAYEDRKLKSAAQLEKLMGGPAFVAKWAFKPKTGYTIADSSSSKPEVKTLMDQYVDQGLKA